MNTARSRAFVERLPKCELHLHFEGAVPVDLARKWGTEPIPDPAPWESRDYRFPSFEGAFLGVMAVTWKGTCNSLERVEQVSTRIYEDLHAQRVRYLEMSFGIGAYPYPADETLAAFKSGVPEGMTVRIIGALSRDRDIPVIRSAGLDYMETNELDGLDVHGDERVGDPGVFADYYETARTRGLILKAHAGELRGPESVEEVIERLGVTRIEHGVRGVESPSLMERYIDEDITLDVCPWSNVKLGVYPDLATHPVTELHRAGVRVTVSTDDPTPFSHTLTDEYEWLITECGMSFEEVGAIAKNGFQVARMPDADRERSVSEIDAVVAEFSEEDV